MAVFDKRLAGIIEKHGLLPADQCESMLSDSERSGSSFTELLLANKVCTEESLVAALATETGYQPINLRKVKPAPEALEKLSEEQCLNFLVLPIARLGRMLTVAIANPFDVPDLDNVKLLTGCEVIPVLSTETAIRDAVKATHSRDVDAGKEMDQLLAVSEHSDGAVELTGRGREEEESGDITEDILSEGSPVVRMVNLLVLQALEQRSSDIHIEPYEKRVRIRFRVDGACHEAVSPPKKMHQAMVSRIKIMSGMDIAERRKPQDGKFQMRVKGRQVDFRVSILPLVHGEKVCIRLLDTSGLTHSLDGLGFESQALEDFRWAVMQPYGMLLVTGPTGSGKSTTLYSAIREVVNVEDNITTVEDPVEYQMEGVNQVQVNEKRELTFAAALRSILRQDPDTVMIGEIRDRETAEIGVRAALTGHLVLSTLHTNDAPSTVTRLVDMGIDPFMVASSVLLVSAQRLLRKLCTECRQKIELPPERLLKAGCKEDELAAATFHQAKGCARCSGGYKGRFAILETMRMREDIKRIVLEGGSALDIRGKALEHGMITLRRCALLNAMRGKTSLEEVMSMTLDEV